MKILFLTDNFPPEVNAPATRTLEHCKEWVKAGEEVTVITCFPNFPVGKVYPGYRNKLFQVEEMEGIKVIRVWSYITANKGIFKRTLDYISYGMSAVIAGMRVPRPDVIIATSPQFFTAVGGRVLSLLRRVPWMMEIRDLWPESIQAVGAIQSRFLLRFLEGLEMRMYRSARHLIVVTDTFKRKIEERGIPKNKISVIKNGVDADRFYARSREEQLKVALGLEGKFVVGYIGTHGMAHGLDIFIRQAENLPGGVHLLLIGDGAEKERLKQMVYEMATSKVHLLDAVPRNEISRYMSIIDVALVPLRKRETFKTVIPSKIFEAAALEIPILLGVEGEAKQLLDQYSAGLSFEPENFEDFIEKLIVLSTKEQVYKKCQEGGRQLALDFARPVLARRMLDVISTKINN